MSNRRKPNLTNRYRSDFLRSRAWFARRDRWFEHEARLRVPLACAGCGRSAVKEQLELHHLDYRGVQLIEGTWRAWERHQDLVSMHPYCHELLHRLIDRDAVLGRYRSRRTANQLALTRLRHKLAGLQEKS